MRGGPFHDLIERGWYFFNLRGKRVGNPAASFNAVGMIID
jgi:hypothetical protein